MVHLDRAVLLPLIRAAAVDRPKLDDAYAQIALDRDQRESLSRSIQDLLTYIDRTSELEGFRGGQYRLARGTGPADRRLLVNYLTFRATESSPETAADDLQQYLNAEEIPCLRRTLISGIRPTSPFQLDDDTRFIPWGPMTAAEDDRTLKEEGERLLKGSFSCFPSGIIERPFTLPKIHVPPGVSIPEDRSPEALFDARGPVMALQLVCAGAVFGLATWTHFPVWCIAAPRGGRWFQPYPERTGMHELSDQDIATAKAILEKLNALSPPELERIWLMVHRLSLAQSHLLQPEDAIDLRVACEMTFFYGGNLNPEYQGELRFRLAMLAARLLGQDYEDRKRIREIGSKVYDMCSGAVHAGRISEKYNADAASILKNGAGIVRAGLKHIVLKGRPDWLRVMLE